jgi:acyl-CoA thioester hydrolase
MGTYYNSRVLEWFECGRTELLRAIGVPYVAMETRGILLPLVEAHVEFGGRARYDDELKVVARVMLCGKARLRFDVVITQAASGAAVARGYTVHATVNRDGRPVRPPAWLLEKLPPPAP